ncbi:hypothetical protein JW859_11835 [bacterium]|nr:hypothetical protein [bacterium]
MSTIRTKHHTTEPQTDGPAAPLTDASGMPEIRQLGICTTCVHQGTCLFLAAARKPVWFCDEFDDVRGEQHAEEPRPVKAPAPVDQLSFSEAQHIGLCTNCESRKECMHRQPGQAVWECEDYR